MSYQQTRSLVGNPGAQPIDVDIGVAQDRLGRSEDLPGDHVGHLQSSVRYFDEDRNALAGRMAQPKERHHECLPRNKSGVKRRSVLGSGLHQSASKTQIESSIHRLQVLPADTVLSDQGPEGALALDSVEHLRP